MAKKSWKETAKTLIENSENVDMILADFQEQAKSDLLAEITSLEADLIRRKQAEKRAQEAYEKSAFTITEHNDISSYIRNRDSRFDQLSAAQFNTKAVEKTLVRRRDQLKELE